MTGLCYDDICREEKSFNIGLPLAHSQCVYNIKELESTIGKVQLDNYSFLYLSTPVYYLHNFKAQNQSNFG